ncbi:MAG: hypothetical protein R3C56_28195 [Pirellulaceae bacterium]
MFKDITPLLTSPLAFDAAISRFAEQYRNQRIDSIVAAEARGFIFGAPLALRLQAAFVPVRKPGKLPSRLIAIPMTSNTAMIRSRFTPTLCKQASRVLVIDDPSHRRHRRGLQPVVEQFFGRDRRFRFCDSFESPRRREETRPHSVFSLLEF